MIRQYNRATDSAPGLGLTARTEGGITIAELAGELDIANSSALRETLSCLLRPGCGRVVMDLSKVSFCDASGLAVLVSTARRARLLGGFLRLAAVSPQVGYVLNITQVRQHLAIFPTVQAAVAGTREARNGQAGAAVSGRAGAVHPRRVNTYPGAPSGQGMPSGPADAGELREAATALLACADAWRDADPGRRFTPALRAMASARDSINDPALDAAARSLLFALTRYPLPSSPAVAATATRLRRVLTPPPRLATI